MGAGELPTDVTLEQVHEALLCLYSPTELARCSLVRWLTQPGETAPLVQLAQMARSALLDAVEMLRPGSQVAPSASASRAYECLNLRYVSGLSVDEVAFELSLSPRQVYRDLRWGEERLLELLRARAHEAGRKRPSLLPPQQEHALGKEIETLERKPQPVDLARVVREATRALTALAERHGVTFDYDGLEAGVVVTATPGVLKEVVIQLLSAIAQGGTVRHVAIALRQDRNSATLVLPLGRLEDMQRPDLLEATLVIAEAQRLNWNIVRVSAASELRLTFPLATRMKVLVVEDNAGASALYERYLEDTEWEVVPVPHPRLAGDVAVSRGAQAIILDVMMPDADGWSVLQVLKLHPKARTIPVIICSVVNDRELGQALGASDYLTKPVSRPDLLQALRQLARGHSSAADG